MRHHFITILLLCIALPVHAVYRCEQKGAVTYADQPCVDGHSIDISEDVRDPVSQGDAAAARKRLQQQKHAAAKIDKEKLKEDEREEKARQAYVRKTASKDKSCQPLALQKKWAEEDLAGAKGKSVDAARRKAQRAAEKYELHCKPKRLPGLL